MNIHEGDFITPNWRCGAADNNPQIYRKGSEMMPETKNLKKYRALIEENQEVFAKVLNCSNANYSLKEQGKVPITLEEAEVLTNHISKKLGRELTVNDVFFTKEIAL